MAIAARLRESLGIDAQSIWSDDGIALHFPESDTPPPLEELMIDPGEVEDLVVAELGDTALFGARFRENAGRSLLIPRRRPGERTPLWQQRLKAQSLLQVARKYGSFPVILETYRECLQDVFDLPALRTVLQGLKTRELDLVEVETQSASPYSTSLLFDYIATYMYEDDTPPAERRAQALSLDRDLLRELLGQEELRDLLDHDARRSSASCKATRRRPTISTTSFVSAATCGWASTTRTSPSRCSRSGARSASRSLARSG
jgi:ATP-dependent Lhr-like helicase